MCTDITRAACFDQHDERWASRELVLDNPMIERIDAAASVVRATGSDGARAVPFAIDLESGEPSDAPLVGRSPRPGPRQG